MTNPKVDRSTGWATKGAISLAATAVAISMTGCEDPPPPPQIVQAPPVYVPPPPPPPDLESIMAEMNIDTRIHMDENDAPTNAQEVRAVLGFFDAWVRGNNESVKTMLGVEEKGNLDDLVAGGQWTSAVGGISHVQLVTGNNPMITGVSTDAGSLAVLAIFTVNDEFQPTLWYMGQGIDGPEFISAPTPPDILNRIEGDDMIAAWHKIIQDELARGTQPDVEISTPQTRIEGRGPDGQPIDPNQPGPGPGGPSPGGPPGPGGAPPGGPGPGVPL